MKTTYQNMAEAEAANLLAERQPLALDGLLTPDQRRLETALGSSKPMPQGQLEELLDDLRRIEAEHKSQPNNQ